jgi:WD40 repeat protein
MKSWSIFLLFGITGLGMLAAQQPQPGKPPPLPPINPAIAKLDVTLVPLDGPGFAVAASNDNVAAACEGGTIYLWNKKELEAAKKGPVKGQVLKAHTGPVVALAWNGGPILASAGADKKLILWKMPEGKPQQTLPLENVPRALAMSADGKLIASAGEDVTIQIWDVAAAKPGAKLKDHADWIMCLAFNKEGKQLASGDLHGNLRLWDVAGAKKIAELPAKPNPPPKTPPDPIAARAVAFGPDGKSLYYGDAHGAIQVLNLADGKTIRTLAGHTGAVTGLLFHPTGALLVSTSKDRTVKLWNPANPQPVKNLEGHTAWVEGLALFDQFTKVATVSADQTVKIWDLAEPAKKK